MLEYGGNLDLFREALERGILACDACVGSFGCFLLDPALRISSVALCLYTVIQRFGFDNIPVNHYAARVISGVSRPAVTPLLIVQNLQSLVILNKLLNLLPAVDAANLP